MIDLYEKKVKLEELAASIKASADAINVPKLNEELAALKEKQTEEGFWNDTETAKSVNMRVGAIERKIEIVEKLSKEAESIGELLEMAEETSDAELAEEVSGLLETLDKDSEKLFLETLLSGKYDSLNAIITLHAGAGGTEAQDWTEMLFRMYRRFGEREGFKYELLDLLDGDEAGIKSVTFKLSGENAYGFLKCEKGVHRLVRISPFDSNSRRHTSFASVEVMPEIIDNSEIVIRPEDIDFETCRSSGAGGQKVNKTSSAVRITHIPTGIVTWCQNERSQLQNREAAMNMLRSKLAELKEREQMEEALAIKGQIKKIEWGSQIRSYVFCPYTLVKDHRTGMENTNVDAVMDGDIEAFIYDYLIKSH